MEGVNLGRNGQLCWVQVWTAVLTLNLALDLYFSSCLLCLYAVFVTRHFHIFCHHISWFVAYLFIHWTFLNQLTYVTKSQDYLCSIVSAAVHCLISPIRYLLAFLWCHLYFILVYIADRIAVRILFRCTEYSFIFSLVQIRFLLPKPNFRKTEWLTSDVNAVTCL